MARVSYLDAEALWMVHQHGVHPTGTGGEMDHPGGVTATQLLGQMKDK